MPSRRKAISPPPPPVTPVGRLDALGAALSADTGATLAELVALTGWRPHSVRGAMAGALKKRGLTITSVKEDGVRTYRAAVTA